MNYKSIFNFLFISAIFTLIFTQDPLYSSNQNLHFLHGLAKGGLGYLKNDWLAQTKDPFPVFNLLVFFTYKFLDANFFYFYYSIILGIYLYSILGIVSILFNIKRSYTFYLFFITVILFIHSRILDAVIYFPFGVQLGEVFHSGLASFDILGPILQPSVFGVFLFLSIYYYLRSKILFAILSSSVAVIFHPSYFLSAVILNSIYTVYIYKKEKKVLKTISFQLLFFGLVGPILMYNYVNFHPTSTKIYQEALKIFLTIRIPHHYLVEYWLNFGAYIQIFLMLSALWIIREKKRILYVMLSLFSISLLLSIIQLISRSLTIGLLLPWRTSVILVPLSSSIIVGYILSKLYNKYHPKLNKHTNTIQIFCNLFIFTLILGGIAIMVVRFYIAQHDRSTTVMKYIQYNKQSTDVYLIPVEIHRFKLEKFRTITGASIFVDFKSHPYNDMELIEWYRRIRLAENYYREPTCQKLDIIRSAYKITHVINEVGKNNIQCSYLKELYRDAYYIIYEAKNISWGNL